MTTGMVVVVQWGHVDTKRGRKRINVAAISATLTIGTTDAHAIAEQVQEETTIGVEGHRRAPSSTTRRKDMKANRVKSLTIREVVSGVKSRMLSEETMPEDPIAIAIEIMTEIMIVDMTEVMAETRTVAKTEAMSGAVTEIVAGIALSSTRGHKLVGTPISGSEETGMNVAVEVV